MGFSSARNTTNDSFYTGLFPPFPPPHFFPFFPVSGFLPSSPDFFGHQDARFAVIFPFEECVLPIPFTVFNFPFFLAFAAGCPRFQKALRVSALSLSLSVARLGSPSPCVLLFVQFWF